jgi:protein-disulfide isomerase
MTFLRLLPIALVCALASSVSAQAPVASGRAIGPVIAAVRIDVFSDFQCPACKALAEGALKRVKEDYALKGKIRLVHHDFPLPMHPYARHAAALAAAAEKLGKYDKVGEVLFREQPSWSVTGNVDAVVDSVLTPAEQKQIREIVKDPAIMAAIDKDIELGKRTNVQSTPTMIVTHNGKPNPVVGVVSYPVFSKYLDSLLTPQ